jgi:hypothetical protein
MAMGMLALALASGTPATAQLARTDAIWARTAPAGSITLDGNLNEAVWAQAESWKVRYRVDLNNPQDGTMGIPGSGWKDEGGINPPNDPTNDSTNATLKFLVIGNKLYMGANVPDRSIGGGGGFNYFDGFLMGLKDHADPGFPKPINEYLYSWWYPRDAMTVSPCAQAIDSAVGNPPIFKGKWAPNPVCDGTGAVVTRTAAQIDAWDARTRVNGALCNPNCGTATNNDNNGIDQGYTIEMVFDLGVMGYDVTQANGDIVEWNISIYDTDNWWRTPLGPDLSRNRTWWQNAWGLDAFHDEVRIYAKPSVTTASGPAPAIDPDFRIPITGSPAPTINGTLSEAVWAAAPSFDIRWDDAALRASYPGIGKYRSGQFQPRLTINDPDPNPLPFVANGGDGTVKYFFKGDNLYMGFDVRDTRVQGNAFEDMWDGFTVSIYHRTLQDPQDHNLEGLGLSFHFGPTGGTVPADTLSQLVTLGLAQVAMAPKAGTTVDTTGTSADDTGYTAELRVDLKALGYPPGLGDHTLFLGVNLHDHDRFSNPLSESYSTRTWWYKERKEQCCPAWTLLDGTYVIGSTTDVADLGSEGFLALGNSPNPFQQVTNLEFTLGRESDVELAVFDVHGRLVTQRVLGRMAAGKQQALVQLPAGKAGVYLYRVKAKDPATGSVVATLNGKMMHLR